jgi:hypothetical protein
MAWVERGNGFICDQEWRFGCESASAMDAGEFAA